jgi:adenylosuccinate synthase
MQCDIIVDLSRGDSGKGKIANHLLKTGEYSAVVRFSGAHNCGHTIIHEGKKVVTHAIPAGVLHGIKSIIGPGCCINPAKLMGEIAELEAIGIDVKSHLKISNKTHIITDAHLEEDGKDVVIGTTRTGSGPAFRDKYGRTGTQAHQVPELKEYLIDFVEEVFTHDLVLFEGAQGTYLDIIHGDYPYVTSSHCTVAGALLNGVPPQSVRRVYGVIKAYETYVGAKEFAGRGEIFDRLQEVGEEFGATTGRPRQCNFVNLAELSKAIKINGVTNLIVNKMDVMQKLDCWNLRDGAAVIKANDEESFKAILTAAAALEEPLEFSYAADKI